MKILITLTLIALSMGAYASENSKREKLVELVSVMNMDKMLDSMYSQMEMMMQNMSTQMEVQQTEQAIFDEYYSKMTLIMKDSMSWKKMEPMAIEIYDKNFNESEITEMLVFYKTDTGKAILAKMPVVMQQSMQMGQALMQDAIPKIQEIAKQLEESLKNSRNSKK